MLDFYRMKKECFWDVDISESEMMDIALGEDERKKQYICEKILLNSTKILNDIKIFNKTELKKLLANMEIPKFNGAYVERRKNLVEVYFFDAELLIDELKWIA